MEKNYNMLLTGAFISICLTFVAGIWYFMNELAACREEYDFLKDEQKNFASGFAPLQERNKILHEINDFQFDDIETVSDTMEFYSKISEVIENNNLNMLSMSSNQNENSKGNILTLKLQGSYYSLAYMLAELRKIPFALRINELKIMRNQSNPEYFVDVDMTVEALMDL